MLTFHATMPSLSPATLRWLDLSHCLIQPTLAGVVAWLFGPGGLLAAFVYSGCMLAAHAMAEAALHRWGRRRVLPFLPRREWRSASRRASDAAPVGLALLRGLAFGLAVAQLAQARPVWALDSNGWIAVAFCTVWMFLFGLWNRGAAAADAWSEANSQAASEPSDRTP